jgi:hypothetical protein
MRSQDGVWSVPRRKKEPAPLLHLVNACGECLPAGAGWERADRIYRLCRHTDPHA